MKFSQTFSLFLGAGTAAAQFQPIGAPFVSPVTVAPGLAARVIFSNLSALGDLAFDSKGTLLAVELGVGISTFVKVSSPSNGWQRTQIVKNSELSYGLQVDDSKKRLYASTGSSVLVYQYDAATRAIVPGSLPYALIDGIPADGEFSSHPLLLEKDTRGNATAILVGSGPLTNIDATGRDPASGYSQVRRFVIPTIQPTIFPPPALPWSSGEVIAYGIRNPAGFAFQPPSLTGSVKPCPTLYVVENGASIDNITGLTPQFVNDNPGDELNAVDFGKDLKKFYGFPDCSNLWNPDADPVGVPQYVGRPKGDQFSLNLPVTPARPDKWCKDPANNKAQAVTIQAHSSPVDIEFYESGPTTDILSIPAEYIGDAFVSFFGSFNRSPPTGYGVVRVYFPVGSAPTKEQYSFIVQARDLASCPDVGCITPSGLAIFGGKLFVASVLTGEIFLVQRSSFTTNP